MTNQLEALIAEMKAAAEKATPLQLDTAQIVRGDGGYLECPCCEGAGYVEEEKDFCNIDGEPLGVQFYGIGPSFGLAESYFRQVAPKNVLTLIAALEQSQEQISKLESFKLAYMEWSDKTEWVQSAPVGRFGFNSLGMHRADVMTLHIEQLEAIKAAAEKLVRCKGRYHSEQNYRALAALFGVITPDLPPLNGESSQLAVKLPSLVSFDDMDANSQDKEIIQAISECKGWNAAITAARIMNSSGGTVQGDE